MISQKTIETILSAARIEEVIGEFINLKKRGVNYLGLCPFHDEKTPSFTVSPSKEIFKCFGCGKAGNTVTFLMEHEKYTYPQALLYLAKKYNIEVEEEYSTEKHQAEHDELESLYIVLGYAQKFYENYLFQSEEGINIGQAYFKERNFSEETIRKFNLGFSPSGFDHFTREALKDGHKEEFLVEAGLTIKTQDGRLMDRFRERVMFPILSVSGRTLGFGARILRKSPNEAKYINSPESKIYSKSNVVYGLYQARTAIRKADFCYMVEGYTDVISLHQAGIENVVASLGTSLTENHVRIIKRFTGNLTFIYDGDDAGIKASFRGIDMGLKEGLRIRSVPLPDKEDPDSFARSNPKPFVQEYVKEHSEDFILFKSRFLFRDTLSDPLQKAEGIRNIIQSIIQIPNIINRNDYLQNLSRITKIDEETLTRELNNQLRNRVKKQIENPQPVQQQSTETKIPSKQDPLLETVSGEHERKVMQLLVEYGNKPYLEHTVAEEIIEHIKSTEWDNQSLKEMFDYYLEYYYTRNAYPDINEFLQHPNSDFRVFAAEFIAPLHNLSENWSKRSNASIQKTFDYENETRYCLKHFELRKLYSMKKKNLQDLRNPDLSQDEVEKIMELDKFLCKKINTISRELSVAYY